MARAPFVPGPVVAVTGLLTVLAAIWFSLNRGEPWGPPVVGWALPVTAFVVMVWDVFRLSGSVTLVPAARRFWRTFGLANAANLAAVVVQAYFALTGRSAPNEMPRPTIGLFLVAVLMLLWAMLRLPVGTRSRSEWIRLILDGATVVVASALFTWLFAFEPLLHRGLDSLVLWGLLGAVALMQLAVAAVVKVLLAGAGPIDPRALRILCLGLFAGSVTASISRLLADHAAVNASQLSLCPLAFTAALAIARQRGAASAAEGIVKFANASRRPVSLLPYAAIAATQILLIGTADRPGVHWVVILGAVAVTCLVVARQWGAVHEIARLVTTVRRQEERLRHQATHDPLTQLANRSLFGERLETALDNPALGTPAVILIDLDDFKPVNDRLGHAVGDGLLTAVADRLRACVRVEDLVCRLGGDEFVILLADAGTADLVARRVLSRLAEPVDVAGHRLICHASLGLAAAGPGDGSGRLLSRADIAMYAAKRAGKSSFVWYDDSITVP